ncbi:hypothetical protein RhiirC2_439904 [Rhizophagus irregularis]|uniref:Uncharacterized protein n=1 Tax=Rhizophagus irregularis TaxID=588596 RepID=A0A2N1M4E5_9GLOM|nr:hypothetical protein RhiirC2_439904 [Rhizophagus irregularis]
MKGKGETKGKRETFRRYTSKYFFYFSTKRILMFHFFYIFLGSGSSLDKPEFNILKYHVGQLICRSSLIPLLYVKSKNLIIHYQK